MHVVEHHDIHHDDLFSWKKIHMDYRCIKDWEARLYTMNLHSILTLSHARLYSTTSTRSLHGHWVCTVFSGESGRGWIQLGMSEPFHTYMFSHYHSKAQGPDNLSTFDLEQGVPSFVDFLWWRHATFSSAIPKYSHSVIQTLLNICVFLSAAQCVN